jgi:hypothetical protein
MRCRRGDVGIALGASECYVAVLKSKGRAPKGNVPKVDHAGVSCNEADHISYCTYLDSRPGRAG